MGTTEEILIGIELYALLPPWTEILDVRLHERRVLANGLNFRALLRDDFVHDIDFA
jgi:hypothetical protein